MIQPEKHDTGKSEYNPNVSKISIPQPEIRSETPQSKQERKSDYNVNFNYSQPITGNNIPLNSNKNSSILDKASNPSIVNNSWNNLNNNELNNGVNPNNPNQCSKSGNIGTPEKNKSYNSSNIQVNNNIKPKLSNID